MLPIQFEGARSAFRFGDNKNGRLFLMMNSQGSFDA